MNRRLDMSLAVQNAVAAGAAYTAHYDKIACEFPEIAAIYDFRHSLCRPAGTITTSTRFPNLVMGGPSLIPTMAAGLSFTGNALRFNGGTFPATGQMQVKLDASIRPTQSIKQFGLLLYVTIVARGGSSHGIVSCGTQGFSTTISGSAGPLGWTSRTDNGAIGAVFADTTLFPYPTTQPTFVVGTPTLHGYGYYNGGAVALASRRTAVQNELATVATYTNDNALATVDAGGTDLFIGDNGVNSQNGLIFDLHRMVVVRMTTEPASSFKQIAARDWALYGAGVVAGYAP